MISDERLDLMKRLAERRVEAGRMDMVMNSEEVAGLCGELLALRKSFDDPAAQVVHADGGKYARLVLNIPEGEALYRKPSTD